ncbi:MAG: TadE/TadG family type IV pilus assembly protein [Pseudobdellovibrionaceae bacterium]|jgi:Flp pilus assembly protein TadG|nr:TadE/TadG family type IV pilus assembly protein [Pseudobdellovibrionaceae bacterium]
MRLNPISFIRHWFRNEDGSTAVEFSMVGMGFILLMMGILEFGRFAWTSNVIDYAVDEAARYAILHQDATTSEVETYAKDRLNDYFVPKDALNLDIQNTSASGVDFIEISGHYHFTSMISGFLPESLAEIDLRVSSRRPVYAYD